MLNGKERRWMMDLSSAAGLEEMDTTPLPDKEETDNLVRSTKKVKMQGENITKEEKEIGRERENH